MNIPPDAVELLPKMLLSKTYYDFRPPARVESIGQRAFVGISVRKLGFPDDTRLRAIRREAFRGTPLTEFLAPASLRSLGQGAFAECAELNRVVLNEGLETIGTDEYGTFKRRLEGAFQNSGVREVTLPTSLKRIEYSAFRNCQSLRSIALPKGLRSIGPHAFYGAGLQSIAVPRTVQKIEEGAFARCRQLHELFVDVGSAL